MFRLFILLLLCAAVITAQGMTYVVLWFDTEDYVDPIADDAALRIANDLTGLDVQATFKIVGEKARVLEARHRRDVIEALTRHAIGYHSDLHSIQPVPALDLEHLGWLEGADEFQRRQEGGFRDVSRIFGIAPVCYGQPGSSWAPQSNRALRRIGVHVYLDEGIQVGVNNQPFWYDGLLYVFNMGPYQIRADPDGRVPFSKTAEEFDDAVQHFAKNGGGLISTYYHPTEFVHTEFWDAVNFANGATRERKEWVLPHRRTPEETERCYRILTEYVKHAKQTPGVRFITANDLLRIYSSPVPPLVNRRTLAQHFQKGITFLSVSSGDLSAANILLELLGMPAEYVDGPTFRGVTTYRQSSIPEALFDVTIQDVRNFIQVNHRLPSEVFVGSERLSLADFAATLAGNVLSPGTVQVAKGKLEFERYFSNDAAAAFKWPIHPQGFAPAELLELGRLQGWTLKPARLR
ncbi:MAG TPA: hypothetical protein VH601_21925 [Bryobacteraceae bacterium]|jgi:hypothetical protein